MSTCSASSVGADVWAKAMENWVAQFQGAVESSASDILTELFYDVIKSLITHYGGDELLAKFPWLRDHDVLTSDRSLSVPHWTPSNPLPPNPTWPHGNIPPVFAGILQDSLNGCARYEALMHEQEKPLLRAAEERLEAERRALAEEAPCMQRVHDGRDLLLESARQQSPLADKRELAMLQIRNAELARLKREEEDAVEAKRLSEERAAYEERKKRRAAAAAVAAAATAGPDEWREFPCNRSYECNRFGSVRNKSTQKEAKGRQRRQTWWYRLGGVDVRRSHIVAACWVGNATLLRLGAGGRASPDDGRPVTHVVKYLDGNSMNDVAGNLVVVPV